MNTAIKVRYAKIAYVSCFTRVQKASFVQVLNMCDAFVVNGTTLKLFGNFTVQSFDSGMKDALKEYLSGTNGRWNSVFRGGPAHLTKKVLPAKVIALFRNFGYLFLMLRARIWRPDIIYTRDYVFALLAKWLRVPAVMEVHESNSPLFSFNRLRNIAKLANAGHLVLVIATTEKIHSDLVRAGVAKSRLAVLPNAAPPTTKYNSSKSQARKELNISENDKVIVYTGKLYEGKGVKDLVEAARILPKLSFIIVGGGRETSIFKSSATDEIPENIRFVGEVAPAKIPTFQLAADILVATLHDEYFQSPLKIAEYAVARRPMVVTDIPLMHNRLTNEKDAMFYRLNDAQSLASKITHLLDNPKLADVLVENAFQKIGKWTWNDRASDVLQLIEAKLTNER